MSNAKPQAGGAFPGITVPLLNGDSTSLGTPAAGKDWKVVVVYRGKHCPICTRYLVELNKVLPDLHALGVDAVAVSADSHERATAHMREVNPDFPVGYDLNVEQMKALGLYISGPQLGMDAERPFAEPGVFVVNEAGKTRIVDISNVPFARPDPAALLMGIRFLRNRTEELPVNGTYA